MADTLSTLKQCPYVPGARILIRDTVYRVQFTAMRQYESTIWYDINGRVVFTTSKGLVGVGLPRKAIRNDKSYSISSPGRIPSPDHEGGDFSPRTAQNIALGWEKVRDLKSGTITREVMEDTLPGGPRKRSLPMRRRLISVIGKRIMRRCGGIWRRGTYDYKIYTI